MGRGEAHKGRHVGLGAIHKVRQLIDLGPQLIGNQQPYRLCRIGIDLRYQLFYRTAAAVLEAKRYAATTALLLIHSFGCGDRSQSEENRHAQNRNDYEAFLDKIGMRDREAERVNGPIMIDGVALYSAWIDEGFPLIPSEYSEIRCTFNKNTPCQIQLPKE